MISQTTVPLRRNPHSVFGIRPPPFYCDPVNSIPARLAVIVLCFAFASCATGKSKSKARLYEGDTSPNIRMYEEKPGYPLNHI